MKTISFVFFSLAITLAAAPPSRLELASAVQQPSASAGGNSTQPAFSADGRFIVFLSQADNLTTNDDHGLFTDVFVRNVASGQKLLVSVDRSGFGGGNENSHSPSLSADGRFVAFVSAASNLLTNGLNQADNIYVRDLISNRTLLVTLPFSGAGPAAGDPLSPVEPLSANPMISADGHWIVFESVATNLVDLPDTNRQADVFLRNLQTGRSQLLSVNTTGTAAAHGSSTQPVITPDGRVVAFVSTALDLLEGPINSLGEIYVRDLSSNTTRWASQGLSNFLTGPVRCSDPVLSDDGRFVIYKAASPSSTNAFLLRHDLQIDDTELITSNAPLYSIFTISTEWGTRRLRLRHQRVPLGRSHRIKSPRQRRSRWFRSGRRHFFNAGHQRRRLCNCLSQQRDQPGRPARLNKRPDLPVHPRQRAHAIGQLVFEWRAGDSLI